MSETYLVRAKLDFVWGFDTEYYQGIESLNDKLPVTFGPFKLDRSPNWRFYLRGLGFLDRYFDPESSPDREYPVSFLYLEREIQVKNGQHAERAADDVFEQVEAMLRLFQEGGVYLRRDPAGLWQRKNGVRKAARAWPLEPVKAEPTTSYDRGAYNLNYSTLTKFIRFFKRYWDVVHQKPVQLYIAVWRFSASYERRTLADRLTELMVAMEALFGDGDTLRYKIPLRCACILYPPGRERKDTFLEIKKLYDARSKILHGDTLELAEFDDRRLNQFENHVRMSIIKFLELYKKGSPITQGAQLDDLLFLEER